MYEGASYLIRNKANWGRRMHCNSERRIRQTLETLNTEPCWHSFLQEFADDVTGSAESLRPLWSRFVKLAGLDPYTLERVRTSRQWQSEPACQAWVDATIRACKVHDSEFNLILEETIRDRFTLAAAILCSEGSLDPRHR